MADADEEDKTEDPTGKRLEDSQQKGQVAKSQEVNHFVMLVSSGLVLAFLAGTASQDVVRAVLPFLERPHEMIFQQSVLGETVETLVWDLLRALSLPIMLLFVAAFIANVVQHKPTFALTKMKPDFKRISPLKGLKRMFSSTSLVNLAKAVLKIVLIGLIMGFVVWPKLQTLRLLPSTDLRGVVDLVMDLTLIMLSVVAGAMAPIAAVDMMYQKFDWRKNLRMTKQEVKEETKDTDGDPKIKARIRQLRFERSRQRMMAAVPTADVVVTNPTHFAVALSYQSDAMNAPKVVAKGQDLIAQKIREVALAHDVPLVENPPLARALYRDVEIDQEVPSQFYRAVAEVIGYVMRLNDMRRARGR